VARSTEDIVEEIEQKLRPLKARIYKPPEPRPLPARDVIRAHIDTIVKASPDLQGLRNWRSWRDKARVALLHVRALENALRYRRPLEKQVPTLTAATEIEPLTHLDGPDPRLDGLQWLCAHQACVLIEELSKKPVVQTWRGNAHAIARALFEAVTGKPASASGLLQAVRKAKRFRDGDPTAAPQVQVRGYFRLGPVKTNN
jgi:hypothetical protein